MQSNFFSTNFIDKQNVEPFLSSNIHQPHQGGSRVPAFFEGHPLGAALKKAQGDGARMPEVTFFPMWIHFCQNLFIFSGHFCVGFYIEHAGDGNFFANK